MTSYSIKIQDLQENFKILSEQTEALIVPMLKANGYGLGAQKLVEIFSALGACHFAFSRLEEALAVNTDAERWVLSCYGDEASLEQLIANDIVTAVDSLAQAHTMMQIAERLDKTVRVHLAVDTGFGRFGFDPAATEEMLAVSRLPRIEVEGIFSHLGASFFFDDPFADQQLARFEKTVGDLQELGFTFRFRHIANSCALLRGKKFHLDAVRVGSALLGRLPVAFDLPLKRIGKLESEIMDIRRLPRGHNIGYGKVYNLTRDSEVAVLPVGSADGVQMKKDYDAFRLRDLLRYGLAIFKMMLKKDNRMRVRVDGKCVPVLGRVALTHTMIDVTGMDAKVGDKVEIPISPLQVADHIPRIYE